MHHYAPLVFNSWEGLVFWAVFVWAFLPEMNLSHRAARPRGTKSQDAGTIGIIFLGNATAIFAAFVLAYLPRTVMPYPHIHLFLGTGMIAAGSLLRRWCWRVLGKHFTGNVVVVPDQPVIDRGPYRLVRHPSYTAGIAMLAGIGVAVNNWLSLAVILIETCLVYGHRVRVEERALVATLGEPYRAYMARTKRFIPHVL